MYFSMEEREYLEEYKDLYHAIKMEVPQPLTSPDLSSERTTPERCPRPLLPQDCNQEDPDVPQDHQVKDLTSINTAEKYVWDFEWWNEEISLDNCQDDCTRRSEEQLISSFLKSNMITEDTIEAEDIFPDILSYFQSENQSSDHFNQVLSSDSSQTIHKNGNQSDLTANKQFSSLEYGKSFPLIESQINHTKEEIFSCSECEKYFNDRTNRVIQKRIHTLEKPYSRPECEKCFTNQLNPVTHQTIHTGNKPYSCSDCGKYFTYESDFARHQRIHRKEKPYSCSECRKSFSQKSNLIRHQRIHTGEKPYSCLECGKYFNLKTNLIQHQVIHTGEKPYSCSDCGKYFNLKSNLIKHQVIHTGEKPYSCSECGKCFSQKANLVTHLRIHTGEKPYSCLKCGKCFNQKSSLVTHKKIHIGKNVGDIQNLGAVFQTNWNLLDRFEDKRQKICNLYV